MSTELETKQDETIIEESTNVEESAKVEAPEVDKVKELELANARLQGMLDAKSQPTISSIQSVESEQDKYQKTKQTVIADASAMDNTDFEEKYKMSKGEAKLHFTTYEFEQERSRNSENMAILRAENQIVKKYGDKYDKYREKI